ncbi:7TM GPCR, serpentine receptor class e (Sre) family-containing protein [Strongyloides ratti]|uniref:7TM GPCR, serpentine receptor class e (Sre) family-containing protein n=1 Tax=Strongyloides ratti TaxID=34506 RepID=A0A090MWY4_STRRB|nr:7TM GPCR, serpentine receptor class e (Sre) family-containing protein [Strongyloides ratti]CEF64489.1 7TM GPCR, serpentine receptor class e (Sre) family-containing protein [Strongyloides ratti]
MGKKGFIRDIFSDTISSLLFTLTFVNVAFLIERLFAVKYYESYENFNKNIPWMGCCLIFVSLILGTILRILGRRKLYEFNTSIIVTLIVQIILLMIICGVMKIVKKQYKLNERIDDRLRYKKSMVASTTSIRYQTIENRNVIKLMTYFSISCSTMSILNVIVLLIRPKIAIDLKWVYFGNLLNNITPYFTAIFVPLTIILTEKKYHKKGAYVINTIIPISKIKKLPNTLENVGNKKIHDELKMDDETKKKIYFSNYNDQWR